MHAGLALTALATIAPYVDRSTTQMIPCLAGVVAVALLWRRPRLT
ncbi:hypothetical protein OHA77_40410 [Streptosporangium sp. NBC_01639]|nr:hypothetical protein OHA77_40410 [Streptosporangium sp. NBC_01639]